MALSVGFAYIGTTFLFSSVAFSACKFVYDWQSGNNYMVCDNINSTTTYGNNLNTGSTWNQTQNSNGTYSGIDSNGNFYSGDNNTGSYWNSDGTTCFGTGIFRTCN